MKSRLIKAALVMAALVGLVSRAPSWLASQGATTESLVTREFWISQWALVRRFAQSTLLPLLGQLHAREWVAIGGGAFVLTGLLVLLGRKGKRSEKARKKPASPRRDMVLRLVTRGQSAEAIARHTGLSRDAVRAIRNSRVLA